MSEVILYHAPPSFFSQITHIALAEKGVRWSSKWIVPGPPTFESYEPWYMRLNPGGSVSTLVHDGHCTPDSFAIARYVDANFEGPPLIPDAESELAEMERWIGKLGEISVRELSYGSDKLAWIGVKVNGWRVRNLKRRERNHPELAEVYRENKGTSRGFPATRPTPRTWSESGK